jgi:hypothetical protein
MGRDVRNVATLDPEVWAGVNSLLDDYVELTPTDVVVLAYSPDSYEAAVWVSAAIALRGMPIRRAPMLPLLDSEFAERLNAALPPPEEVPERLVVLTFERDTMSHDPAIRAALSRYGDRPCVVMRAISSSAELFSTALRATPTELSGLNTALLERCLPAQRLRVTTEAGTELRIRIDSEKYRWISNRGKWRPGSFVILPAGEVATYPASIEGRLVADFAFNVNAITDENARLTEHPVIVRIEESRAVEYSCSDAKVSAFLDDCFQKHCAFNVGEVGFGTNPRIKTAIPLNSHINERRPGVHLGFGQHNQDRGVAYRCNIHLDLIAAGGQLWVDDDPEPIDLEHVIPSTSPHPDRSRDQDVFSPTVGEMEVDDCCGILREGRISAL